MPREKFIQSQRPIELSKWNDLFSIALRATASLAMEADGQHIEPPAKLLGRNDSNPTCKLRSIRLFSSSAIILDEQFGKWIRILYSKVHSVQATREDPDWRVRIYIEESEFVSVSASVPVRRIPTL